MIFADYKLTLNYYGRIPIDARGAEEAVTKLEDLGPTKLVSLSERSDFSVSTRVEPLPDLHQLDLFEVDAE